MVQANREQEKTGLEELREGLDGQHYYLFTRMVVSAGRLQQESTDGGMQQLRSQAWCGKCFHNISPVYTWAKVGERFDTVKKFITIDRSDVIAY